MIKFQLFDTVKSYQCRTTEISTFVVSIAHYMRAYFNVQALSRGQDFELPADASYLNCEKVKFGEGLYLYGKIGCMERATFTSTKLQLQLYTDPQCSQMYDDGRSAREHAMKGYLVVGEEQQEEISTSVSFQVPFYECSACTLENGVSDTFSKLDKNWYDDLYVNTYGYSQYQDDDQADDDDNNNNNDNNNNDRDWNQWDDQYMNDDWNYNGNVNYNGNANYYYNNNNGNNRGLRVVLPEDAEVRLVLGSIALFLCVGVAHWFVRFVDMYSVGLLKCRLHSTLKPSFGRKWRHSENWRIL